MRAHFIPQHWLLCHMRLHSFEFEFGVIFFTRMLIAPWIFLSLLGAFLKGIPISSKQFLDEMLCS